MRWDCACCTFGWLAFLQKKLIVQELSSVSSVRRAFLPRTLTHTTPLAASSDTTSEYIPLSVVRVALVLFVCVCVRARGGLHPALPTIMQTMDNDELTSICDELVKKLENLGG